MSESLDYFVLASATSTPHLQALERHVQEKLEEEGFRPRPTEGQSPAGWSWTTGRWWSTS